MNRAIFKEQSEGKGELPRQRDLPAEVTLEVRAVVRWRQVAPEACVHFDESLELKALLDVLAWRVPHHELTSLVVHGVKSLVEDLGCCRCLNLRCLAKKAVQLLYRCLFDFLFRVIGLGRVDILLVWDPRRELFDELEKVFPLAWPVYP